MGTRWFRRYQEERKELARNWKEKTVKRRKRF
jgi:hypothetical protein